MYLHVVRIYIKSFKYSIISSNRINFILQEVGGGEERGGEHDNIILFPPTSNRFHFPPPLSRSYTVECKLIIHSIDHAYKKNVRT